MAAVFQGFDSNKDGVLSWEEVWTSMEPLHKQMSKKAFKWQCTCDIETGHFEQMIKEMFNASDANKDGVLQLDEFKQFTLFVLDACSKLPLARGDQDIVNMFGNFDANKDGVLSWDEVWSSIQPLHNSIQKKIFKWDIKADITDDEFRKVVREMFDAADANSDGVLVLDEFKQFVLFIMDAMQNFSLVELDDDMKNLFERFDSNKDGVLDWEEIWNSISPL